MSKGNKSGGGCCCCVPLCKNYQAKCPPNTAWFSFPRDEKYKKIWVAKIRRDIGKNFQITKSTRICSHHFLPFDKFPRNSQGKVARLKKTAVPSIFPWTTQKIETVQREARLAQRLSRKKMTDQMPTNNLTSNATTEEIVTANKEVSHCLETQTSETSISRMEGNFNSSQQVFDVMEAQGPSGVAHIFGKCINNKASNEAPFNVVIRLSNCRQIVSAKCECKTMLGNCGKCKHVEAVAHFANVERDQKKTNHPQEGQMPGKMLYPEGATLRQIFNLPDLPKRPPMTDKEKRELYESIKHIDCPLRDTLKYEVQNISD